MSLINIETTTETRASQLILEYLSSQSKPCFEKLILKMVRGRKQHKIAALRRLVEDGQVIRNATGVKGDPFQYSIKVEQSKAPDRVVVEEILI